MFDLLFNAFVAQTISETDAGSRQQLVAAEVNGSSVELRPETWTGVYRLPKFPEDLKTRLSSQDTSLITSGRRRLISVLFDDMREKFGW